MIHIGLTQSLKIIQQNEFGLQLEGENLGPILLPKKYVPDSVRAGESIQVFVHLDSEDRIVATTEKPMLEVGQFGVLEVVSISRHGAFLSWGLAKDLFLPHAEQLWEIRVGEKLVVTPYVDKSNRLSASMRVEKFLKGTQNDFDEGQAVDLLVYDKTDLGYKCIVDGHAMGLLYKNEVFQKIQYGETLKGFVKAVRSDAKIDLMLTGTGHRAADPIKDKIMQVLQDNGGFFEVNDKTEPELIYRVFSCSKKKFKIALGGLYKEKKILISDQGIRIVKSAK